MGHPTEADIDYEILMQSNLDRVFNERDPAKRMVAITELYDASAVFYEPRSVSTGHLEIRAAIETLLARLPPDFVFSVVAPGVGHHDMGRMQWQLGPRGGTATRTGTDVVQIADGRIIALHVFLDVAKV